MKERKLARTSNVVACERQIYGLLNRTRTEQRGLALIYGDPGLGKTMQMEQMAFSKGWMYLRMQEKCSSKWFLTEIYNRLTKRVYGAAQSFKGTLAELENACIEIMADNPQFVIVLDEINLPIQFRRWDILEEIRDFVDMSFVSIIMVGEHDSKNAIERYNKHFFDRCMFFYQYKKNSLEDYRLVIKEISDIELDDELLEWVMKRTGGNLRKLIKTLDKLEMKAGQLKKTKLGVADFKGGESE